MLIKSLLVRSSGMKNTDLAATRLAETILNQMGGAGRVRAMTGAQFAIIDNGVEIRWPSRTPTKGNMCSVVLEPCDTYTVTFFNKRAGTKKQVAQLEDVYCDCLVRVFEAQTGYYLHF